MPALQPTTEQMRDFAKAEDDGQDRQACEDPSDDGSRKGDAAVARLASCGGGHAHVAQDDAADPSDSRHERREGEHQGGDSHPILLSVRRGAKVRGGSLRVGGR